MRVPTLLASLVAAALAGPAASQTGRGTTLGEFRAVELRDGGRVTVLHGATRALTLRGGNLDISRVEVVGDWLVIERCRTRCPRGYRLEVEVTAPELDALAVTDGGLLQASGDFPARTDVVASVSSGGMVDARALPAERVTASVSHGGGIFVRPSREMTASVSNGGLVTYWGEARVRSSVRHGGAVVRGSAEDRDRPLADLHPQPPSLRPPPAVPPVPPLPPSREY